MPAVEPDTKMVMFPTMSPAFVKDAVEFPGYVNEITGAFCIEGCFFMDNSHALSPCGLLRRKKGCNDSNGSIFIRVLFSLYSYFSWYPYIP